MLATMGKRALGAFGATVGVLVACGLLLRTDDSVKCIAEKVGIPDQFYFSRLFSARYGASPARYRKARLV